MSKEIERKWLVELPNEGFLKNWKKKEISQYYTKVTDTEEIRYRRRIKNGQGKCYKTMKYGNGLEREEYEDQVPLWVYEENMDKRIGNIISKDRFIKDGWELDLYESPSFPYWILEREFASLREANNYDLPEGIKILKEVTEDKRFKNKNIALCGFPKL
jgi:CYTH domain-containing protein